MNIDFTPSWLDVDANAQLLPGLITGVESLDQSFKMVTQLAQIGVKKIVFAAPISLEQPHTRFTIERVYGYIRNRMLSEYVAIDSMVVGMYRLDRGFMPLLNKGNLLSLPGNHLLVDLPIKAEPVFLENMLFELENKGYIPVLAHPERYVYYHRPEKFKRLKDMGCLFQLSLLSVAGFHGVKVKRIALQLIKANMIDFVGSCLQTEPQIKVLKEYADSQQAKDQFKEYPLQNTLLFKE